MKDKRPDFNDLWAKLINDFRNDYQTADEPQPCPNCGQVHLPSKQAMVLRFVFQPGITQDDLLDGIGEYLKGLLAEPEFRARMGWVADGSSATSDKPSSPKAVPADDYAKPRYADYIGRPVAFDRAKLAWRRRMVMLGYDPNLL